MGLRATVALCVALVSVQALETRKGISEICRDVAFGTVDSDVPLHVHVVAEFSDSAAKWSLMHKQMQHSWTDGAQMTQGWVQARALAAFSVPL